MFHIDPAELHRVFPATPADSVDAARGDLAARLMEAETRISEMQEAARLRDDSIADLRRRLDDEAAERRRLTVVLADQRAAPPVPARRSWLPWRRHA